MSHTEEVTAAVSNTEPALESPPVNDQSSPPLSGHVETSAPMTSPLPPLHGSSPASPAAHWVSATGGSLPRPQVPPTQTKSRDEEAAEIVASLFQKWGIKRKSSVTVGQWGQSLKGQNELISFIKKDGRIFAVLFGIFFGCFLWLFLIYKLKSPGEIAAPANAGAPGNYAPVPQAGVPPHAMHGGSPTTAYAQHYMPPGSVHAAPSGVTLPAAYPVQQPMAAHAGYVQQPMSAYAQHPMTGYPVQHQMTGYPVQQPMATQSGYVSQPAASGYAANPYQYAQTYSAYPSTSYAAPHAGYGTTASHPGVDQYYANYQFPHSQAMPVTAPTMQPYTPMAISPNAAANVAGARQKVCVER